MELVKYSKLLKEKLRIQNKNESDLRHFLSNWYQCCVCDPLLYFACSFSIHNLMSDTSQVEGLKRSVLTLLPVMEFVLHSVLIGKSFVIVCDSDKHFEIVRFVHNHTPFTTKHFQQYSIKLKRMIFRILELIQFCI